jgi:hypothetical protein
MSIRRCRRSSSRASTTCELTGTGRRGQLSYRGRCGRAPLRSPRPAGQIEPPRSWTAAPRQCRTRPSTRRVSDAVTRPEHLYPRRGTATRLRRRAVLSNRRPAICQQTTVATVKRRQVRAANHRAFQEAPGSGQCSVTHYLRTMLLAREFYVGSACARSRPGSAADRRFVSMTTSENNCLDACSSSGDCGSIWHVSRVSITAPIPADAWGASASISIDLHLAPSGPPPGRAPGGPRLGLQGSEFVVKLPLHYGEGYQS